MRDALLINLSIWRA